MKRIRAVALVAVISSSLVLPWTVRNRVMMGSWMPIKSNGMFELWQSQCLDNDGVLDWRTTSEHPWPNNGKLRGEYRQWGEMEFIASYGTIVKQDIPAQPLKFFDRIAGRTLAATVWHMPYAPRTIWPIWLQRIIFPLPVAAALFLLAARRRLSRQAAAAIAITALAPLPYALVSYYDRYAMPLIGMKMLIVLYAWHALSRAWLVRTPAVVAS